MSYQEYQVVSCEPDSLLDGEGNPYEIFGNDFLATEGERPQCVNTESDGKHVYRNASNPSYSVAIFYGETQLSVSYYSAPSGGHTVTGNISISSGQFNGCWILISCLNALGYPLYTQGFVFEGEELDDPNNVGFKVVASHNQSAFYFDLVRKTHN